jgi:hypothetical protein
MQVQRGNPKMVLARRALAGAILIGVTTTVLCAWLQPSHEQSVPMADAFCALAPQQARATPGDPADLQFAATVPLETPPAGLMANYNLAATQGDVIRVSVSSPRDGGVAVHGLLDVRPIAADGKVTVEFRAIYSGRFPVHFHGADGSHFEIAAIEVMPPRK